MCGCTCATSGGGAAAQVPMTAGSGAGSSVGAPPMTPGASVAAATQAVAGGGDAMAARPASNAREGVLLIGDSLTVGAKPYFTKELVGAPVEVNATGGISLAEGMRRYDAAKEKPRVVEMALFTNNSPGQQDELRSAIEKTIKDARKRGGRVVWATIVRPGNYDGVNAMIRDLAAKNADVMGVVDWAKMIKQHPEWMAGDKVHATPAGYKARAKAFADAARA